MTSRDFVYWLQGYFEISNNSVLTEEQVSLIKSHLDLVFHNETRQQMNPIGFGLNKYCSNSFMSCSITPNTFK